MTSAQAQPQNDDDSAGLRQRMEALSAELHTFSSTTGTIAHDFNNLLAIVIGNLDLLSELVSSNPELEELARAALSAALRGVELNQRLLDAAANPASRAA